jgi:peptidoglycan-N-acetylmuramic acid deacetylase
MNRRLFSLILSLPMLFTSGSSIASTAPADIDLQIGSKQIFEEYIELDDFKETQISTEKIIIDGKELNSSEKNWFFKPTKDNSPAEEPPEVLQLLKKYDGYYLGDTSKKVLYLTFDEGYENGYTPKILDALKENNVKAAFFVTTDYINSNIDIIKRMVDEGHLVCNHSNSHPSMARAALKSKESFKEEFTATEKAFEDVTGQKMPKFFRPPMGKYSELSMHYTKELGYKTVFWSFAYKDWLPNEQPSHDFARKKIMDRTHNGAIILLHAVSKTNADIMDSIIKELKGKGYEFDTLDNLPKDR